MSDARDPQALIAAAEQTAVAGDYAAAEKLLREAAALQEARLGPLHADLANTLNNLGVVCELADNPVDAEHYFRRACAIATAILEPDHPFVATSRKNLEDFCAARGKAVKLPGAVSLVTAADHVPLVGPHSAPREHRTMDEPSMPEVPDSMPDVPRRRMTRGVTAAVVVAGLILTVAAAWFASSDRAESPVTRATPTRATPPAPRTTAPESPSVRTMPSEAPREALTPESAGRAAEPQKAPTTASTTGLAGGAEGRAEGQAAAPSAAQPVVAVAQLCRTLSTRGPGGWRCVPPDGPLSPGPLFFYTRLKTPAAVSVQHRWYRGDRVHRVVELRVGANALEGYRTYSRTTVDARSQGDWRVELTTRDGAVLHEERFVVR